MSQTLFQSLYFFYQIPSHIQIGMFREWLSERAQCTSMEYKGYPLWIYFIQHRAWQCLEELFDQPSDDILINEKDELGRGFIHLAVYADAPSKIIIKGIDKMNEGWDTADSFGHTPFDILPPPEVAQKLAGRYWTERRDLQNTALFFEEKARQAREEKTEGDKAEKTARVWDFWVSGPSFSRRKK